LLNLESEVLTRLTHTSTGEEYPIWQPDGQRLAFVVDSLGDREIFALDLSTVGALGILELSSPSEPPPVPLTWLGRTDGPAWSPGGDRLAAVFHRWDGDIDLTASNSSDNTISMIINNGDGTFSNLATYQIGNLPWGIQAADFDLDGDLDIAGTNYHSGNVSILFNINSPTQDNYLLYLPLILKPVVN
jgi:hypothetical protein